MKRVDWIDAGRLPLGELCVLAGIGGLGKSAYVCAVAARITRGESGASLDGSPRSVVFCSAEDSWEHTLPRLLAVGADLGRVFHMAIGDEPDAIAIPDDLRELEGLIEEQGDVALVVFDPLVAFLSDKTDTHRDHDTRRALGPLASMAQRTKVCVLGVMHLNKKDGADPYQRLSASVAFYNAVRSVLFFGVPPTTDEESGTRVLVVQKMNLVRRPPTLWYQIQSATASADGVEVDTMMVVSIPSQGSVSAPQLIGGAEGAHGTRLGQAMKIAEELIEEDGFIEAATLKAALEKAEISLSTGRDATRRLGLQRTKVGFSPARWYVHRPDVSLPEAPGRDEAAPSAAAGLQNPRNTRGVSKKPNDRFFETLGQGLPSFGEDTDLLSGPSARSESKEQPRLSHGTEDISSSNGSIVDDPPTCEECGGLVAGRASTSGLCRACEDKMVLGREIRPS